VASNGTNHTPTSGSDIIYDWILNGRNAFQPSSGTASFIYHRIKPTYNTTGTYSGTIKGLVYDPILTSVTGADHIAIETVSGNVLLNTTSGLTRIGDSFASNPSQDTSYFKGNTRIQTGNLTIEKTSGTPYLNIIAKAGSGNQEAGIYLKSREGFAPIIEFDATSPLSDGKKLPFYNYNTARGGRQVFVIGAGNGFFGAKSVGQFFIVDSLDASRRFSFNSNGTAVFDSYGTGTKEAADISKTESVYTAIYATDGTILEKRANTEQYNNVTSTTSPVTLSSTIADNLINQGSTQATFTLNMPASPVDGQVCMITYNNAITTLTIDGNGNTIVGSAVTTAVAGSQRKFKFYTGIGWIKQY
jgi:hypothetical protein